MEHLIVMDMSNVLYKSFYAKKEASYGSPFVIKQSMSEEEQEDIDDAINHSMKHFELIMGEDPARAMKDLHTQRS